jgi:hypothetical protein
VVSNRNKNRWALVSYQKNEKLEDGGKVLASGEELPIRVGETLVLRVRGYDRRGKGLRAVELAVTMVEDPYR